MDRKQWVTLVYREANLFLENHARPGEKLTETEVDELEPELHQQVQEVLRSCESLEDVIKHSLLKDPSPDHWYGEGTWSRVLASVAAACLVHDVKGIVIKILDGELQRVPSGNLHQDLG
ncbi:MAG: hypothetical protein KIS92_23050 [Planctomycetota bacterium]|nr:hypothetical protein [Planctomycetota bacterium]